MVIAIVIICYIITALPELNMRSWKIRTMIKDKKGNVKVEV